MSDDANKTFWETKTWQFVRDKLPTVAGKASSVLGEMPIPGAGAFKIIGGILDSNPDAQKEIQSLSQGDLAYFQEVMRTEQHESAQHTQRHSDFQATERTQLEQEDVFTKRARPFRQYAWTLMIIFCTAIAPFAIGEMLIIPVEILILIGTDMGYHQYNESAERRMGVAPKQGGTSQKGFLEHMQQLLRPKKPGT